MDDSMDDSEVAILQEWRDALINLVRIHRGRFNAAKQLYAEKLGTGPDGKPLEGVTESELVDAEQKVWETAVELAKVRMELAKLGADKATEPQKTFERGE